MIDVSLRTYWILVSAARRGDKDCHAALELAALGYDKEAELARKYLAG